MSEEFHHTDVTQELPLHYMCGRPGWHSKSHANFRPRSQGLRTRDPRSVAPETPSCEHLRYTRIGDGRRRRAVPFRPSRAGATRSNNRSTLRRELLKETVWKSPSALDHFYGKTGTLSVLVLTAPVWTTECPYILSVCWVLYVLVTTAHAARRHWCQQRDKTNVNKIVFLCVYFGVSPCGTASCQTTWCQ